MIYNFIKFHHTDRKFKSCLFNDPDAYRKGLIEFYILCGEIELLKRGVRQQKSIKVIKQGRSGDSWLCFGTLVNGFISYLKLVFSHQSLKKSLFISNQVTHIFLVRFFEIKEMFSTLLIKQVRLFLNENKTHDFFQYIFPKNIFRFLNIHFQGRL